MTLLYNLHQLLVSFCTYILVHVKLKYNRYKGYRTTEYLTLD